MLLLLRLGLSLEKFDVEKNRTQLKIGKNGTYKEKVVVVVVVVLLEKRVLML